MSAPSARARQPNAPESDDASIPMLTERLTLPPLELDTTLPCDPGEELPPAPVETPAPVFRATLPPMIPPAPQAPAAALPPAPAALPASALAPFAVEAPSPGGHWTRIEVELRASILNELAESLPQEVDAIVRSRMSEAIDRLIGQLAAETRLAMAASLRDIVDHAVRTELDRLRGRKR